MQSIRDNTCNPLRILLVHNQYQLRGGEDTVVAQEAALLKGRGHKILCELFDNDHIVSRADRISAAAGVVWNRTAIDRLLKAVNSFSPDIVHFHNFFPLVSPGALAALADAGLPIVQTLHNYRVICPGGMLMRDGHPCEACVGSTRLSAIVSRCYRRSFLGSGLAAMMGVAFKRVAIARPSHITLIALTNFAASRFVADGFPHEQIVVRPNFALDTGVGSPAGRANLLYVGRLSEEKGVDILVRAAAGLGGIIEIVGDGPQFDILRAGAPSNVKFMGRLSHDQAIARMREARAILLPSRWYEGFPMTIVEAMASGTPVIASDIGSLSEVVKHEVTGLLLPPRDVSAWSAALRRTIESEAEFEQFGLNARREFTEFYDEQAGYASLMQIYERAMIRAGQRPLR